ncbi:hypothetical protein JTB14_009997 [Gonioctena quinquepunctata]|nr:hypothetical protein JTB14_009997 [Gonioctena quinquepunctata]
MEPANTLHDAEPTWGFPNNNIAVIQNCEIISNMRESQNVAFSTPEVQALANRNREVSMNCDQEENAVASDSLNENQRRPNNEMLARAKRQVGNQVLQPRLGNVGEHRVFPTNREEIKRELLLRVSEREGEEFLEAEEFGGLIGRDKVAGFEEESSGEEYEDSEYEAEFFDGEVCSSLVLEIMLDNEFNMELNSANRDEEEVLFQIKYYIIRRTLWRGGPKKLRNFYESP